MTLNRKMPTVRQLPEAFFGGKGPEFFREIHKSLDTDRPRLVLDCSKVARMDMQTILWLLCCLEEAMKRNGDVRLAGVSAQARFELQSAEADALFSFFATNAEAVASFQRAAPLTMLDSASPRMHDMTSVSQG